MQEAREQLGKHIDTFWPKGMQENQQEREKEMNNSNFIIIFLGGQMAAGP